ncbi:hypothetical protein GCM10009836_60650 [Pseudonocardia ailaonensis]|uniref:Uncharacterized protein n=1 Tax=Pseudonocardia ailaonensis TaxID=367279 RepID=A0ABN2NL83_9PSEU
MTCGQPDHQALEAELLRRTETIARLTRERDALRDPVAEAVGLQVALAEYQRRTVMVQSALTRIDQSLALLGAGLAILGSAATALLAGLWTADPGALRIGSAALAAGGWALVSVILARDLRCRLAQTEAEQVQSRLRNLFVSRAPHLERYLSDSIHDDWPTPYAASQHSGGYMVWILLVTVGGCLLGAATGLAVLATGSVPWWVALLVGVAAGSANAAVTRSVLRRALRRRARSSVPLFPNDGPVG